MGTGADGSVSEDVVELLFSLDFPSCSNGRDEDEEAEEEEDEDEEAEEEEDEEEEDEEEEDEEEEYVEKEEEEASSTLRRARVAVTKFAASSCPCADARRVFKKFRPSLSRFMAPT